MIIIIYSFKKRKEMRILMKVRSMMLEEYIKEIEALEDASIEDVIAATYNRLNRTAFLAQDEFIEMLGVFWTPYLKYGIDNDFIDVSMIEEMPKNYVAYNDVALESGLNLESDYEMMILGLYMALVACDTQSVQMFYVNDSYYSFRDIM